MRCLFQDLNSPVLANENLEIYKCAWVVFTIALTPNPAQEVQLSPQNYS